VSPIYGKLSIDHDSAHEKGENGRPNVSGGSEWSKPSQTEELAQMLNKHFDDAASPEIWLTQLDDTGNQPELPNIIGLAYVAPERMTEGTWNLLLIAIHPHHQKKGHGKALLRHVEQLLAQQEGTRILLVETSGTDDFDYVRSFYRHRGYDEEARIREFYAAGVDKIIFRKALNSKCA
jgi:ribosomal protein S18 acetylase RimI-like enzyme